MIKPNFFKAALLCAPLVFTSCLFGQWQGGQGQMAVNKIDDRSFMPLSPTAASLAVNLQNQVSYYTGQSSISIPLGDLKYKELDVPFTLSYTNTSGNKPDAIPGYTGNGWLFNAGGAITMLSKGIAPADIGSNASVLTLPYATNTTNWSDTATLKSDMYGRKFPYDYYGRRYDEFSYNFGGMSGNFYSDYNDTNLVQHIRTTQGEWITIQKIVLLSDTYIPIPHEDQDPPVAGLYQWNPFEPTGGGGYGVAEFYHMDSIYQKTLTYQFIITDSRGIKYTFGGTNASIEFTRPGLKPSDYDKLSQNTVPSAWHLTRIESPNGAVIRLTYKRGKFYVASTSYCRGLFIYSNKDAGGSFAFAGDNTPYAKFISSTLYNPCYLDSIITPVSYATFSWSNANGQLNYTLPYDTAGLNGTNYYSPLAFFPYIDIAMASGMNKRLSNKLDGFIISNSNGVLNRLVSFTYTNDTTTRLKLLSVQIQGSSGNKASVYQFGYDTLSLPPYRSFKADKYGYYNGRNLYITSDNPSDYTTLFNTSTQRNAYIASREPDSNYTHAEILNKITYPTGGYTSFEYENNRYGRFAASWPPSLIENGSDSLTGGLRIKRINSYDFAGHVAGSKSYYYYRNYAAGGTTSSGVLNYKPVFYNYYSGSITSPHITGFNDTARFVGATITCTQWGTDPIYPSRYSKTNPVTYSEVAEVNADKSYSVYTFKNYDNGYHDQPAINNYIDNPQIGAFWKEDDENSLDLERGQSLSEKLYDSSGVLKMKTLYLYNDTASRFNENVRVLKAIPNPVFSANFPSNRYLAYLVYTYYPFLKQKTVTSYEGSDSINITASYQYDATYRLLNKQVTTSSDGRMLTSITRYPKDMVDSGQTTPYQDMVNRSIVSPVIEQEQQSNGITLSKAINTYAEGLSANASLALLQANKTQFRTRAPETRVIYDQYDDLGSPLSITQQNGMSNVYVWSYNKAFPVAKIMNAPSYSTVVTVLGGATAVNNFANSIPSDASVNSFLAPIRSSVSLQYALVTTYTYDILNGVTSQTDENGLTTTYQYDALGRLSTVRDWNNHILKKLCYNYANQTEACAIDPQGYTATHFLYSTSLLTACYYTNENIGNTYAYTPVADVDNDSTAIPNPDSLHYTLFYSDQTLLSPLSTGYYLTGGGTAGYYSFMYIKDGAELYTSSCNQAQPYIYSYSSTFLTDMCAASGLPSIAVFNDSLHLGDTLHYATGAPMLNGYYYLNGYYSYHVTAGIVDSVSLCPSAIHATSIGTRLAAFNAICLLSTPFTVYHLGSSINTGTQLFSDSTLTTPFTGGTYSDGMYIYTINASGIVLSVSHC